MIYCSTTEAYQIYVKKMQFFHEHIVFVPYSINAAKISTWHMNIQSCSYVYRSAILPTQLCIWWETCVAGRYDPPATEESERHSSTATRTGCLLQFIYLYYVSLFEFVTGTKIYLSSFRIALNAVLYSTGIMSTVYSNWWVVSTIQRSCWLVSVVPIVINIFYNFLVFPIKVSNINFKLHSF